MKQAPNRMHPDEESMKHLFGTMPTFKYWDTAWILSDGSLVPRGRGGDVAHHDMIAKAKGQKVCPPKCFKDFMEDTGAIRVTGTMHKDFPVLHIHESRNTFTPKQMEFLDRLCVGVEGCHVHFTSGIGRDCAWSTGGVRQMVEAMERCKV